MPVTDGSPARAAGGLRPAYEVLAGTDPHDPRAVRESRDGPGRAAST
ncbi:hypothetical protein [Streptomyces sp. NPDC020817]